MGDSLTGRVASLHYRVVLEPVFLVDIIEVLVVSVMGVEFNKEFSVLQSGWVLFEGVENANSD